MSKIEELRSVETGQSVADVVSEYPLELDRDAVGIWQIVPDGEVEFGLSGTDLIEFVRLAVVQLLNAGAVPVLHDPESGYEWVHQLQYGRTGEDVSNAIALELSELPLPWDTNTLMKYCPWFARPDANFPKYIKMD